MADYMELAEQLGEAIVETEEYQTFVQLEEALHKDEEAQRLVEIFQNAQEEVRETQMKGERITSMVIDDLKKYQRDMLEHPSISAYMEAKQKVDKIIEAVNDVLGQTTGMGLSASGGGGGCGDGGSAGCGGGCC